MDPETIAPIMEEYVKDGEKEVFVLLITSIDRKKQGK